MITFLMALTIFISTFIISCSSERHHRKLFKSQLMSANKKNLMSTGWGCLFFSMILGLNHPDMPIAILLWVGFFIISALFISFAILPIAIHIQSNDIIRTKSKN